MGNKKNKSKKVKIDNKKELEIEKEKFRHRLYIYIFFIVSFLTWLAYLSYSAYVDLEMCKLNPEYTYHSVYIKYMLGL